MKRLLACIRRTPARGPPPIERCSPASGAILLYSKIQFGSTVTILRDDGRRQSWRIVGEDEAKPAKGTLSSVSPVARVLTNRQVGDVIAAGAGEAAIVAIA